MYPGTRQPQYLQGQCAAQRANLTEPRRGHKPARGHVLPLSRLFLEADAKGYKRDQWFVLELFKSFPSQAEDGDLSRCFASRNTRLSSAPCSRASSGPDTAPRLLGSSASSCTSSRGISPRLLCQPAGKVHQPLQHGSPPSHHRPGCRERAEEAAGVDIILPALTRGHRCLVKAIKAPMLLSPRLKAAPQANTWTSLHSCQLLGLITYPQLATVA